MNPLGKLAPYVRAAIYAAAVAVGALMAGFTAIGQLPDWLIFASAAVAVLTGGTALLNLSDD